MSIDQCKLVQLPKVSERQVRTLQGLACEERTDVDAHLIGARRVVPDERAAASAAEKKRPVSATSVAKLPPPQKWSKAQKRAPPSPRGVSVI